MESGTVALCFVRHVQLALLLKTPANVSLTQGLELGPVLGELLRETPLRRNGAGPRCEYLRDRTSDSVGGKDGEAATPVFATDDGPDTYGFGRCRARSRRAQAQRAWCAGRAAFPTPTPNIIGLLPPHAAAILIKAAIGALAHRIAVKALHLRKLSDKHFFMLSTIALHKKKIEQDSDDG